MTEKTSTELECLLRARIPAVSIKRKRLPSRSYSMSTASRVVPGISLTMARRSRSNALISDDFPAFGRPRIATAIGRVRFDVSGLRSAAGRKFSIFSRSSETPRPCAALIGKTSSKPSAENSSARGSCFGSSILLTRSKTGLCNFRIRRASSRSIGFTPSCPSTTKRMRSLSAIASSADARTSFVNWGSPAPTIPPVSQSLKVLSPISHLAEIRSRVIPGWLCTIAMRRPAIRLNNADFPTFGRPTITMFIALLYQRKFRMTNDEGTTKRRPCCPPITPLLHHSIAALRSALARSVGLTSGLQLADASDDIDHAGNEGEDSRHHHDEPQWQKSQLQHHPRDRAHLTNSRDLASPTWFNPHFIADEIMQDGGADQNDRVAGNDENRKPYRKFSVIGIALAPISNAQGDDTAQEQTLIGDRVENNA